MSSIWQNKTFHTACTCTTGSAFGASKADPTVHFSQEVNEIAEEDKSIPDVVWLTQDRSAYHTFVYRVAHDVIQVWQSDLCCILQA